MAASMRIQVTRRVSGGDTPLHLMSRGAESRTTTHPVYPPPRLRSPPSASVTTLSLGLVSIMSTQLRPLVSAVTRKCAVGWLSFTSTLDCLVMHVALSVDDVLRWPESAAASLGSDDDFFESEGEGK
jgi:hypothetical protein